MYSKEDQIIDYKVVYTRRRSIAISVGPDSGVIIRAPFRTSRRTLENLVISKSVWIKKHLDNYKHFVRITSREEISDGSTMLFRGKEYVIRIIEASRNGVRLEENNIRVGLKNISETGNAGPVLEKWFRGVAYEIITQKFEQVLTMYRSYNFTPSELIIKTLKRRWGSCTSKGKITVSTELVKLDDIYLEYVILHELCHLRHHDHGKEFYKLLSEVFPQWKQRRSELKRFIR